MGEWAVTKVDLTGRVCGYDAYFLKINYLYKIRIVPFCRFSFLLFLGLIFIIPTSANAGKVVYIYTDPQGTPLAEADTNGNLVGSFDYRPYGSTVIASVPTNIGYTGHVSDSDTGLVYMQARYYDPDSGSFLSVDPKRGKMGDMYHFGDYSYASDNPVRYIDPDGLMDYDTKIKGQSVSVHIDDSLPQGAQEALKTKVDAGIAKINDNTKLSKSEVAIISNIKSISVMSNVGRSNVQENTGGLTLTTEFAKGSSPVWMGSSIAHDGYHVEQFNTGKASRGLDAEVGAMNFQREVGMKMGMSSTELGYLENLISDPKQLKSYIMKNP
jgi:RHS repeat-associated protein